MTFPQIRTHAEATAPIVIDGGLGTAAEDRGIDLDHDLWSAELIRRNPDALAEVHAAFAASGARILTTASYQATPLGFERAGIGAAEGRRIVTESVRIARAAATAAAGIESEGTGTAAATPHRVPAAANANAGEASAAATSAGPAHILIAGSVGPYGAALGDGGEYTGAYRLNSEEYASFHRPRIEALAEAGADLLAIETQPRLDEIRAIMNLAEEVGLPAWVSVTLQAGTDTTPHDCPTLPDGSSLAELAEAASVSAAVKAIGVNCVRPSIVAPALAELARHTQLPLVAYPNSGETYDAAALAWAGERTEAGTNSSPVAGVETWPVAEWARLGAQIIGGCCRVRPADIAVLSGGLEPTGCQGPTGDR